MSIVELTVANGPEEGGQKSPRHEKGKSYQYENYFHIISVSIFAPAAKSHRW